MKISDIVSLARIGSKTNTSTYPDTQMLLNIKAMLPTYQQDVEGVNENYMGSIEHRDLRATGTGTYVDTGVTYLSREYNLPSDMIPRIGKVYAKLDGTNWILLRSYDLAEVGVLEEANITDTFTNNEGKSFGSAGYMIFRGSLFLLTGEITSAVTAGLRIWTYSFADALTAIPVAGSGDDVEFDTFGIPEPLHEIFAIGLSRKWKSSQEIPVPLSAEEQEYYVLYGSRIEKLKGLDRSKEIQFERPADKYDNGYNL